jgi:hypothetical protein
MSANSSIDDLRATGKASAVDKLVLSTVNAPYKREITTLVLKECLIKAEPGTWAVHVATFFTDVSPSLILRFSESHGIPKSMLAEAYSAIKTITGESNADLEAELVRLATVA